MAKIQRVLQKIFGSSAPVNEFAQIGSDFTSTPLKTKDLAQIQGGAQFPLGLYGITADASQPPRIEDINALYYLMTSQMAYMFQSGIAEWDADTPYYQGSLVNVAGTIYVSLTGSSDASTDSPNKGKNPTTDTTNWKPLLKGLQDDVDTLQTNVTQIEEKMDTLTPIDMSEMPDATLAMNALLHVNQGKATIENVLGLLSGNSPSLIPGGAQRTIGSENSPFIAGYMTDLEVQNLDSGHGVGSYWPMDQAVRTTDSPSFENITIGGISLKYNLDQGDISTGLNFTSLRTDSTNPGSAEIEMGRNTIENFFKCISVNNDLAGMKFNISLRRTGGSKPKGIVRVRRNGVELGRWDFQFPNDNSPYSGYLIITGVTFTPTDILTFSIQNTSINNTGSVAFYSTESNTLMFNRALTSFEKSIMQR